MSPSRPRWRRWAAAVAVFLVGAPLAYHVARTYAGPAYQQWREARLTRMAQGFIAKGDFDDALLTVRQALRKDQRSVVLWRLAAAAAQGRDSPEAVYYQSNVVRLEPTLANRLALIRLALRYDDERDAIDAIEAVDASGRQSAEFHRLAARAYEAAGRMVAAKLHLYSLLSLEPRNDTARLDLLKIELSEDAADRRPELRTQAEAISHVPELRVRALTVLLRDALHTGRADRAVWLAGELEAAPKLTGKERVLMLAGLAKGDPARAAAYRRQLRADFAREPDAVVALVDYDREQGPTAEATRWFDALPAETKANVAVQEAIARAYLAWGDWARLDRAIAGAQWGKREFMRNAFLAYAARKTGRLAEAESYWRLAVIRAGDSARSTTELLAVVGRWGWQSEQYDLVWKLFALMPRDPSISRQLLAWERAQGHTANLNRIFARQLEYAPDDPMLRNNFAYSSMLLDANLTRAFELARQDAEADPKNPYYVTTESLALYKQNRPAEALALLGRLGPVALSTPERTVLRALYHAATGDAATAADLLAEVKGADLLPEERGLAEYAASEVVRLRGERGEDEKLLALGERGAIDRNRGWLRIMPESIRQGATTDMRTSDSLLAVGDLAGLAAQLRRSSWPDCEHLRFALTAYACRERGDDNGAQSYWRSAVAATGGDQEKLQELETLASHWRWRPEKMDVLNRIFAIDPSDPGTFKELMTYYRGAGRTAELVAVLDSYLSTHPLDEDRRAGFAYYCMLSGLDISRAYVAAREIYQADPNATERRLVYAFALWKQHRPREAWNLVEQLGPDPASLVPAALVRAAVLADMDRRQDAARMLQQFDRSNALPEEADLATMLVSRIKDEKQVSRLNQTEAVLR